MQCKYIKNAKVHCTAHTCFDYHSFLLRDSLIFIKTKRQKEFLETVIHVQEGHWDGLGLIYFTRCEKEVILRSTEARDDQLRWLKSNS